MKPSERPSIDEILPVVNYFYTLPGNSNGGCLHIVLEDGNTADAHVRYCVEYAIDRQDPIGAAVALFLLNVTRTQRILCNQRHTYGG
jgi:hypothetical protein